MLRPPGALERLDDVAVWLAGWQRTPTPRVHRPVALLFAADHGVAARGVSAYPAAVTAAMVAALRSGRATANALAAAAGALLEVIDVGVGRPTADVTEQAAMTPDDAAAAWAAGAAAVATLPAGTDLLALGEMGIGNTTAASAVAAVCLGGTAHDWVGPGTGVRGDALEAKHAAVDAAIARVRHQRRTAQAPDHALDALREVGGRELVAIAGAVAAARRRSLPVLLDGFITTAAAAPLALAEPGALDHCLVAHCSAEPGHARLLAALGVVPLLRFDLRLGEGSGALVALPVVRAAAAAVSDVATFAEIGLDVP